MTINNKYLSLDSNIINDTKSFLKTLETRGSALVYANNQTREMCLAAVKNDGDSLRYVKEQTPEICLEAVRNEGLALRFVKNKTPEICDAALMQNKEAACYLQ